MKSETFYALELAGYQMVFNCLFRFTVTEETLRNSSGISLGSGKVCKSVANPVWVTACRWLLKWVEKCLYDQQTFLSHFTDSRICFGLEKHLWTVWRCIITVTSICRPSQWRQGRAPPCASITPWRTSVPSRRCFSPTPISCVTLASSGRAKVSMPNDFPRDFS